MIRDELTSYLDSWINKIAKQYSISCINQYLKKHLREDEKGTHEWMVLRIYQKVDGVSDESELIEKYEKLLDDYGIGVKEMFSRLLNYFDKATKYD